MISAPQAGWVTDLKVERILSQVPERCGVEARAGRSHAIVMSLTHRFGRHAEKGLYDYETPDNFVGTNSFNPAWLVGVGRIVYDQLKAAGLQVGVEFWHDGVGVESGYNIVVHW